MAGLGVGDALGAAVEFLTRPQILRRFGMQGLEDLQPWENEAGIKLPPGSITDDTQMSVATAEGLLGALEAGAKRGVWDTSMPIWSRYQEWLTEQDDPRQRRYPGSTSLSALRDGVPGGVDDPINDSKGSGGVMRVAPAGLAFPPLQAFEHGAEAAALTHGHPSGYLAAGFLADVVSRLVRGASHGSREWNAMRGGPLPGAIAEAREVLLGYEEHDEVLEKVDVAVELYMSDATLDYGLEMLGEGWIAEEALGIALFCALNFPEDFSEGVLASVNITGDSDTTGAITGALLVSALGIDSIPREWVLKLETAERLLWLADALYATYVAVPAD
jgi:ADP-ribosylglycohydrolase